MKTQNTELNEEQQAAIDSTATTKVVIAGPGSGKTRTLAAAIAREAAMNGPAGIIAITYTNAAAQELEKRVAVHLPNCKLGFCGTLHSFLLKLLSESGKVVGITGRISVLDDEQREAILTTVAEELGYKKLSMKKMLLALKSGEFVNNKEYIVAKEYRNRLQASGLLDFDMILRKGLGLVSLCRSDTWDYNALFVDEFQDSSEIDALIYRAMPCVRKMFVGDPDQAIYSFRGGSVLNLVNLAKNIGQGNDPFKGPAVTFRLEKNYRCAPIIAMRAQALIEHNQLRVEKKMVAGHKTGSAEWRECANPGEEQITILEHIIRTPTIDLADTAILARTNPIADEFADMLKKKGVPISQKKWRVNPPDWKKAKLLLTVMANPYNEIAAYQLLLLSDDKERVDRLKLEAAKQMKPLCVHVGFSNLNFKEALAKNVGAESRERIHDACRQLSGRTDGEWSLNDLLIYLNLGEEQREEVGQGVAVTTIHSAKGREWKNVFIVGAEQGVLPMLREDSILEEERRVMFVGMTRAAQYLHVSWCRERPLPYGQRVMQQRAPSQFLKEMGVC